MITCGKCGARVEVLRTTAAKHDDAPYPIKRKRRCLGCGEKFQTWEFTKALWRKMNRVAYKRIVQLEKHISDHGMEVPPPLRWHRRYDRKQGQ